MNLKIIKYIFRVQEKESLRNIKTKIKLIYKKLNSNSKSHDFVN